MAKRARAGAALLGLALTVSLVRPAISAPSGSLASGPIAVRVTASALNVRSAPSTSASVIGTASDGQVFAAVARSGEFFQVWFGERTAWMHGSYLEDASQATSTVTASALNVRRGAGTGFTAFAQAPAGAVYAVIGSSGDWREITFGDATGWVNAAYLRASSGGGSSGGSTGGSSGGSTGGSSGGSGGSSGGSGGTLPAGPVSAAGFIMLPASGPGFYGYTADAGRWGTPRMIYGIERVARRWSTEHPAGTPARLGVGDISKKNGGPFAGHASHRKGVDADFSLPRNDGQEMPRVDRFSAHYSRPGTQKEIDIVRSELPVTMIFFNDPNVKGRQNWPNHDNHFHVRIK